MDNLSVDDLGLTFDFVEVFDCGFGFCGHDKAKSREKFSGIRLPGQLPGF
jgi:hypothetical protein